MISGGLGRFGARCGEGTHPVFPTICITETASFPRPFAALFFPPSRVRATPHPLSPPLLPKDPPSGTLALGFPAPGLSGRRRARSPEASGGRGVPRRAGLGEDAWGTAPR